MTRRGLMTLCQMDVTGRTEGEPVARRLVTNILDYVAGYAPGPRRTVLYAGEEAGAHRFGGFASRTTAPASSLIISSENFSTYSSSSVLSEV